MLQSSLFTKTLREAPKDEESLNAKLLIRAGYVDKLMAGVYTFLPLGLRVLRKIENIVREEMSNIGGEEVLMPTLQPKEPWITTGRWEGFDALFKAVSHYNEAQFALGPTHEEVIVPLAKKYVFSYRDLPFAAYQIQTKLRDEPRAKSGLLRGREFRMKDLYSFHADAADLDGYYEQAKEAYRAVFGRLGLEALIVEASGGTFSKLSHEFQVLIPAGEDTVYHCAHCGFAKNKEIIDEELKGLGIGDSGKCPACGGELQVSAGAEVGNIFKLNTKYSDPFELTYKDESGAALPVVMGCYGIGTSRIMGVIAEKYADDKGLVWPEAVAPFRVHLLALGGVSGSAIYDNLQAAGVEVLYDERDVSAGEKFADADLLGIPFRAVVSSKTGDKIEVKRRGSGEAELLTPHEFLKLLK
jgi:prolyl-tRNA synthetase